MSNSVRPQRRQPTRLPRPWDSPGKNTGVGCHFLLQCMKVKSQSEVAQSFLTLSDPMDCSPWGSSVHGIFQARVLEWGAIAFCDSLCGYILHPTEKERKYSYLDGSQTMGTWFKLWKIPCNTHLFSSLGVVFGVLWISKIQGAGRWYGQHIAGVLPTPRTVPSMSAVFQRDSKRSRSGEAT